GCGQAGPSKSTPAPVHDPDDVPITEADVQMPATFAEAIPRIKTYRDTIRNAVAAGTPGQAHRSLDELDIVLDKLPSIAKDSGVPKEQWETVNTTAQELRGLFNQLHSQLDKKGDPDNKAVGEPIDQAIAKLEQVTK